MTIKDGTVQQFTLPTKSLMALASEYYFLQTTPILEDGNIDRIFNILEIAQHYPTLLKSVELIDDIIFDFRNHDDYNNDTRSYWAEYLLPRIRKCYEELSDPNNIRNLEATAIYADKMGN